MFAQFDKKQNGLVDFNEFICGLATVCRGSIDDKIHFIFDMYDVSHDKTVSKQELTTLLNHVPKEVLHNFTNLYDHDNGMGVEIDHDEDYEEIDNYTNHDVVERAFIECDLNHEGRLTYEEFKMWVQRNPSMMEYLENILPYYGPKDIQPHHDKKETLPHMKRIASRVSISANAKVDDPISLGTPRGQSAKRMSSRIMSSRMTRSESSASPPPGGFNRERSISNADSLYDDGTEEHVKNLLVTALELTANETLKSSLSLILDSVYGNNTASSALQIYQSQKAVDQMIDIYQISMEDYLWKRGQSILHLWSKRYYLISGNCMYYYSGKDDVRPKGVVFLMGSIIEKIKETENELRGYFGFELLHQEICAGEHHRHEKRVLYCKSEEDRDKWVHALQLAAHVVPIEDEYVVGKELGRGRFSIVCECVHKVTGKHFAVKIIDKDSIQLDEKSLLRTEIAVLKLVNHPNIIHMEGLFESKQYIYIVMEMLKGGELFERIVGRPRFSEFEAAKIIRPLLESVAYLHDLGIVHRDLKPENILCGEELDDLKIADFGLSKMILPMEKMDAACGTLSYVAPEVLTKQGYGKEADLWSVGVIMFLLLCGKLPFDGDDQHEIIRCTILAELKVNQSVWNKLSEEAKSLLTSLLNKNVKERISARDALKHPYILLHNPHCRRNTVFERPSIVELESPANSPGSVFSGGPTPCID